jgi:integrase
MVKKFSPRSSVVMTLTGIHDSLAALDTKSTDSCSVLRLHLDQFGTGPDGRVFSGVHGGELASITYRRAWGKARRTALIPAEYASPLARRVYDLRHACVSTWLNGGVPPSQVAEWAGHSVAVLLRVYAKCIDGQDQIAKRRIEDALRDPGETEEHEPQEGN